MTISYTAQVSSCKRFGCFWKLLFRWKGSIYKLLWPNLMVYVLLYAILSFTYRFLLTSSQRMTYEKFSLHCQTYSDLIPLSFVLGFYVAIVIKRWWDQYLTIPWPDALAVYVSTFISGQDDRARLMRRTIMRYANLSLVLAFRMMCPTVKKRFPTLDHLVEAGFILKNEKNIFENLDSKTTHPKYWLPLVWATAIARRARREAKVPDDFALKTLIDEIVKFRGGCGGLLNFDWISIPLVYTQVVTLAVYSYFAASLMGNQYLDPRKGYPTHTIDLVIPVFTFLQFFFYMGWLLVAETLVNPFGEDDDDFEVNWLIDRNLQISYVIVDEMHEEHPELIRDQYWDEVIPAELPYTEAAKQYYMEPFPGSAFGVAVPEHMQTFVNLSEQFKDEAAETSAVNSRPTRHLGQSISTFQMLGSTLSLKMKKLKRSLKPVSSQPYSMNSTSKINDDDYQDDVFSMSGITFGSTKTLSSPIPIDKSQLVRKNKDPGNMSREEDCNIVHPGSVSSDGNTSQSCSLNIINNELDGNNLYKSEYNVYNSGDVQQSSTDIKNIETNLGGTMQIWNRSSDTISIIPTLKENSGLLDLEYIKSVKTLDYSALEYDAINILFPGVENLLAPKSETIVIQSKPNDQSNKEDNSDEINKDTFVKYNSSTQ